MKQNKQNKPSKIPDYLKNRSKNKAISADKLLWKQLDNRQLSFTFRKNYSISRFIVDFYSVTLRLAIEVVSANYATTDKDRKRDEILNTLGVTILRFSENEIKHDINKVLQTIQNTIEELRENTPVEEDQDDYDNY